MADPSVEAIRLSAVAGGALSIVSGLLLLVWPRKTILVVAALLGVWLIIIGILRLVQAFLTKAHTWQVRLLTLAAGLLYVVVGAVALRNLFATVELLAVIIGLVWIIGGVAEIAWRKRSSILLGILSIAAGLTVLFLPEVSLLTMAAVAGVWLILFGLLQLVPALIGRLSQSPIAAK